MKQNFHYFYWFGIGLNSTTEPMTSSLTGIQLYRFQFFRY